jgi:hypothetical protein
MARVPVSSQRLQPTNVVALTKVQHALWHLGMPILDAAAVVQYKTRAKREMLWRAIRWHVVAAAALVAVIGLGRQWNRVASITAAAGALLGFFGWLLYACDLRWATKKFTDAQGVMTIPPHVSTAATALVTSGVPQESIGIEYLKTDPILFVEDPEDAKRYDLIIW